MPSINGHQAAIVPRGSRENLAANRSHAAAPVELTEAMRRRLRRCYTVGATLAKGGRRHHRGHRANRLHRDRRGRERGRGGRGGPHRRRGGRRPLPDLPGCRGRCRQDLRDAQRGPPPADRGADVVIGFVECHGRRLTEELIEGLEVVPRKAVEYRGSRLRGDGPRRGAAPAPEVALVDELAHTNVPGSGRHEKRWQDVWSILDARDRRHHHRQHPAPGEHRRRGRAHDRGEVRERVPDWVVRKADQIELVDSSPEQLRRRMLHGNIYPQERVPQALTHFFRTDNLIALRELALRFLADETDEELLEYLRRHQADAVWETAERIMVGGHRRAGHRRAAAPGGPDRVPDQSGPRRPARRRRRRQPARGTIGVESCGSWPTDVGARWHEIRGRRPGPGHHPVRAGAPDHPDRDRLQPAQPLAAAAGGGSNVGKVIREAAASASTCTSSPAATRPPPRPDQRPGSDRARWA